VTSSHFETVRRIAADVLEVPAARIAPDSSPDTLEQWDSNRHMNLVLAVEGEYGIEFSEAEIESIGDMPALLTALAAKVGA
jgi:acyl carrier protein